MAFMMKDAIVQCYQVLEIEVGVSLEEVKQAYRELVKVWHPDRFQNDPKLQYKAQEKLKQLNAAYSVILEYLETADVRPKADTNKSSKGESDDERVKCFLIGQAFYFGQNRPKNFNEAAKHITKSAQLGYDKAQVLLGQMYYRGEGVSKDISVAVEWSIKAAEQGHRVAQHFLGVLYSEDFGSSLLAKAISKTVDWKIGDSKIEAYKWFNLAVTNGYAQSRSGIDKVSFCLTQGQINEARVRASKFYPTYPNISVSQTIHEWFGFYLTEIQKNPKFTKWHNEVVLDIRQHPGIETDIVERMTLLLENEFSGKKGQQAQAFFQAVGSTWKGAFGQKSNRTDRVRVISLQMKEHTWSAFSSDYVCQKENILNYLWLKIYAGK
jgi:DnaJ-like protein/Sel1 repeat-containing protein